MPAEARLAIHGGPPAVTARYHERWRRVRIRDIVEIGRYARRDVNTLAKAEGPIAEFEREFARLSATRYALSMNSGTAALHSAYFAVGVRPGAEVIVPAYTFFASAAPILQCGARPVFCDVDARTLTADPDDVERRITERTRAICVVHMWGNPAAMDSLQTVARRHDVALIEDCSHAHGATYRGRPVGSWGDVGCFSLQGAKAVSGGEAGIAVTSDPLLFDRMLLLGQYGRLKKGQAAGSFDSDHLSLGVKYRPHLYAILMARGSLARLEELNRRRRHNYAILEHELAECRAVTPIATMPGAVRGGFLEYILRYDPSAAGGLTRTAFIEAAAAEGVPIAAERYSAIGKRGRMLHQSPIFAGGDIYELACGSSHELARGSSDEVALRSSYGLARASQSGAAPGTAAELPVTASLQDTLMTMPPLTKVPERFVHQCVAALRKVVNQAQSSSSELAAARVDRADRADRADREQRKAARRGVLS